MVDYETEGGKWVRGKEINRGGAKDAEVKTLLALSSSAAHDQSEADRWKLTEVDREAFLFFARKQPHPKARQAPRGAGGTE
jgi:hypothetical protein